MTTRRASLAFIALPAALIGLGLPTSQARAEATAPVEAASSRTVTLTYLQSKPGRLAQLQRFVRANWFAMDEIAVQQGLLVSYEWLDTGADDGPWNAIVMVTYADDQGFEGIRQRWAAIRSAHQEVRPDGLGMSELGRVLETKNLLERVPFALKQAKASNSR